MSYRRYQELGEEQKKPAVYKVIEITNLQEKTMFINTHAVVCVNVGAVWCNPCQLIYPDYASMAKRFNEGNRCLLLKENYDLGLSPDVTGVPTFQFYFNGVRVETVVGANLDEVEKTLKSLLKRVSAGFTSQQTSSQALSQANQPARQYVNGIGKAVPQDIPSMRVVGETVAPQDHSQEFMRDRHRQDDVSPSIKGQYGNAVRGMSAPAGGMMYQENLQGGVPKTSDMSYKYGRAI